MRATRQPGWWVSLLMASAAVSGCSRGSPGPAELFLDTVVSAAATSGKPDLWVSSVAGPSSVKPGSGYFITVTACNQGVGSADAQVKLFLSRDTSITAEDALVGSTPVGPLRANQCTTLHVETRGAAGVSEGLWYLGALIDPEDSVNEVSETNNSRAGTRMAIGSGPELSVARVSTPASVSPSDRFEAAVEVCNTGTASAAAEVEVFLLASADIASADKKVGGGSTGLLREGQCTTVVVPSTAEVPRGQWHVAAWVDRAKAVPELVESNNTRIGDRTVVGDGPDFTVASVSGPATLPSGSSEPLTLTATVCNEGNVTASALVEAYLSMDSRVTDADVLVGSAPVEELAPGQCAPVSLRGAVNVSNGLWHVAAWVDRAGTVTERVESNNLRLGERLPAGRAPDLVLSEVNAPGSVAAAQPVRTSAKVCNPGTAPSAVATVSFFLSLDASITTADALLGSAPVPELRPGACAPVELTGLANVQEGSWYVGAYADSDHRVVELSESNNTRAGGVLAVGDGADLYVSSISAPTHLQDVQSFAGQVTVCNQGTRTTRESARVGVFLSSDAAITASDLLIGDVSLPGLAAGECTTFSVPGARLPGGTWYLGAIVDLDGREPELLKDNNIRLGSSLAIGSTLAALYAPGNAAHD